MSVRDRRSARSTARVGPKVIIAGDGTGGLTPMPLPALRNATRLIEGVSPIYGAMKRAGSADGAKVYYSTFSSEAVGGLWGWLRGRGSGTRE
jgi:hypothetical protein